MRYFLSSTAGQIEIDETEYFSIAFARSNLFEELFIEDNFDFVLENYYEFENELLNSSLRMMIQNILEYQSMSEINSRVCRRLANFFSACRMYLDHSEHHISRIHNKTSDFQAQIRIIKEFNYDNCLSYRFIENMRNFVQHRGLPIQSILFNHEMIGKTEDFQILRSIVPYFIVSELSADKKFKKSILREMKDHYGSNEIDARPIIREYVECIWKIQTKIRDLLRNDSDKWLEIYNFASDRIRIEFHVDIPATNCSMVRKSDTLRVIEMKSLFKDYVDRKNSLQKKNYDLRNLNKKFVTNSVSIK
jgi:hypothetical protein